MEKIAPKRPGKLRGPKVVALVYDGLCTFEFAIVAEIFGLARPEIGEHWYRYSACAIERGPLRAHGGLTVRAPHDLRLLDDADLIVVPGWKGTRVPVPRALIARLRAAHARGARLASICSGVFVLAATGLLDGQRATTHWRYVDTLREAYPDIQVDANVLYTAAGRVLTSAGSAAGIDLLLHIVREDFGARVANVVARRLVAAPIRDGGQAQFIERPVPRERSHELSRLMQRARGALDEPWPVARLAELAAMSQRTFLRRFIALTGVSPTQWIRQQRVDLARQLLEGTSLSIDTIATRCGFGSVQLLRHHFGRALHVAPTIYRERFRAAPARPKAGRAHAGRR
jgi:AraC family transcriptional activator FtrA